MAVLRKIVMALMESLVVFWKWKRSVQNRSARRNAPGGVAGRVQVMTLIGHVKISSARDDGPFATFSSALYAAHPVGSCCPPGVLGCCALFG
jgi:hypothetical protein